MHRPFMRVVAVLALVICALTVHGRHSHDSAHPPAAVGPAGVAADSSAFAAVPDLSAMPRQDADEPHESHGDACGAASSVHRPAETLTSPLTAVPASLAAADDNTDRTPRPAADLGRNLLLLACISRT